MVNRIERIRFRTLLFILRRQELMKGGPNLLGIDRKIAQANKKCYSGHV